jgi:hypothetical protein
MKQCVTLTLESDYVSYLDQIASETTQSRSMVVQTIIANYRRRQQRMELARQAARFFGQPESPEEAAETRQAARNGSRCAPGAGTMSAAFRPWPKVLAGWFTWGPVTRYPLLSLAKGGREPTFV